MLMGTRIVRFGLLAALLAVGMVSSAEAQNDQGRRQQRFESLLKSLIDSQLNQSQLPPGQPQPAMVPNERTSTQLREIRQISGSLAQETSRLFNHLNNDMRNNPTLSTHFNSTLKINANAAVLAQRSERAFSLDQLSPDYVELNREWQLLAHQLRGAVGLSRPTQDSIKAITEFDQRLSRLFNVTPQIDGARFQRLTESLEVEIQNLLEEVSTELGWGSESRQLLLMGRMVEQQVRYMAYNTNLHQDRDRAVAEFNKFQELWGPYESQLWTVKNRYIERGLQRVENNLRELRQVLWLQNQTDHRQLGRLVEVVLADSTTLFEQTTLADLVKQGNATNLIRMTTDFQRSLERLSASIKQNRDLNQLQTDARMVENLWRQISDSYQNNERSEVQRLVKSTDRAILSLLDGMQIRNAFDRNKAMQLVASLENYGKRLQENFSNYVVQGGRYDRGFAYQGLHTCSQFTSFANNIHQSLADGVPPEELRERCDVLARGWTYLNSEYLQKLQGAERERLNRLSAEITPQIVQLQTMFGF